MILIVGENRGKCNLVIRAIGEE